MSHLIAAADVALVTMTLRRWLKLDRGQRVTARQRMERGLNEQFVLFPETGVLPIFTHRSTGLRLVLVFGDRILMGATDAHRHGLKKEWADTDREADGRTARFLRTPDSSGLDTMTPAHLVDVPSFLLSEIELAAEDWKILGLEDPRKWPKRPHDAGLLISGAGLRWPSEAELDLARILSLAFLNAKALATGLCADAWHQGYSGAPATAEPWGLGPAVQRVAFPGPWPDSEWIGRARVTKQTVPAYRPALSLFPPDLAYAPEAIQARAEGEPLSDETLAFGVREVKVLVAPPADAHLAGEAALDHEHFLATLHIKPSPLVKPPPKRGAPTTQEAVEAFGERYVQDEADLAAIIQRVRQGGSASFDGQAWLNPIDYHFVLHREPEGLLLSYREFFHDALGGYDGSRDFRDRPVSEEEARKTIGYTLAIMKLKVTLF